MLLVVVLCLFLLELVGYDLCCLSCLICGCCWSLCVG